MFANLLEQRFKSNSIHSIAEELLCHDHNKVINELLQSVVELSSRKDFQLLAAITLKQFVDKTDPESLELSQLLVSSIDQFPKAIQLQFCLIISNCLNGAIVSQLLDKCSVLSSLDLFTEVCSGYFHDYGEDLDLSHQLEQFAFDYFLKFPLNCSQVLCDYIQYCYSSNIKIKKRLYKWFSLFMSELTARSNVEIIFKVLLNIYSLYPKHTSYIDSYIIQYIISNYSSLKNICEPLLLLFVYYNKFIPDCFIVHLISKYTAFEDDFIPVEDELLSFESITTVDFIEIEECTIMDAIIEKYSAQICKLECSNAIIYHLLYRNTSIEIVSPLVPKINQILLHLNENDFGFVLYKCLSLNIPINVEYYPKFLEHLTRNPSNNLIKCLLFFQEHFVKDIDSENWIYNRDISVDALVAVSSKLSLNLDFFVLFEKMVKLDIISTKIPSLWPVIVYILDNLVQQNAYIEKLLNHYTSLHNSLHEAYLLLIEHVLQCINISMLSTDQREQLHALYTSMCTHFGDESDFLYYYCLHAKEITLIGHRLPFKQMYHILNYFTLVDERTQLECCFLFLVKEPTNPLFISCLQQQLNHDNLQYLQKYCLISLKLIFDLNLSENKMLLDIIIKHFSDFYEYDFRHLL